MKINTRIDRSRDESIVLYTSVYCTAYAYPGYPSTTLCDFKMASLVVKRSKKLVYIYI